MARRPSGAAIVALVALISPHTQARAGDTSWMLKAKYGVFMHCQHRILLGYSHGTGADRVQLGPQSASVPVQGRR